MEGSATIVERDPTCGMTVDPEAATETRSLGGNQFHFCSTSCADRFDVTAQDGLTTAGQGREEARQREYRTLMRRFWVSALVSVPVVPLSCPWLFPGLRDVPWLARGSDGLVWTWRALGLLTLPILAWGGGRFYRGLWATARSRSASMHTLIGVGIHGS